MLLKKIWLRDFRNHENLVVEFDEKATVVVGDNGVGKTNLLEAICLLAIGRSFRAERTEEMVGWGAEVGRLKGEVRNQEENSKFEIQNLNVRNSEITELEVVVTRGLVQGKSVLGKSLLVNGVKRQLRKFAGNLRVVMFGPADMRLIEGSPSRRRGFLDDVLSQVYPEYYRSLLSYEKGIRRRNKVLLALRDGLGSRSQLYFWDRLLVKEGSVLTQKRREFVDFLSQEFNENPEFKVQNSEKFTLMYDASLISEQRLVQYEREEVMAGVTLVGPHRDDIVVKVQSYANGQMPNAGCVDLSTYGSRGQQRMAVLWLKLGALAFIEEVTGEEPMLLLDDIFSELDHGHRDVVMDAIKSCQTVITAADEHLVEGVSGKVMRL